MSSPCNTSQCYAPQSGGNKRCPNFTVNVNALHCKEHIKKAKDLYEKYKKTCTKLEVYSIEACAKLATRQERLRYLNTFYCLLIRCYYGRKQHRDYGFVPILFDQGHDEQFKIILNTIGAVEAELTKIYAAAMVQSLDKNFEMDALKERSDCDLEGKMLVKRMHAFKKQRTRDTIIVNGVLNKYMNENRKHERQSAANINVCIDTLSSLSKGSKDYTRLFGLQRIIGRLYTIGYLSSTAPYKPSKCQCGDCSEYQEFPIDLFCDCMHNHENMRDHLKQMHFETVATFRKLLENYRAVIKPISQDFNNMWQLFGHMLTYEEVHPYLTWDDDAKRLVLRATFDHMHNEHCSDEDDQDSYFDHEDEGDQNNESANDQDAECRESAWKKRAH